MLLTANNIHTASFPGDKRFRLKHKGTLPRWSSDDVFDQPIQDRLSAHFLHVGPFELFTKCLLTIHPQGNRACQTLTSEKQENQNAAVYPDPLNKLPRKQGYKVCTGSSSVWVYGSMWLQSEDAHWEVGYGVTDHFLPVSNLGTGWSFSSTLTFHIWIVRWGILVLENFVARVESGHLSDCCY